MEKEFSPDYQPEPIKSKTNTNTAIKTITPSSTPSYGRKDVYVFNSVEEAYAAFDSVDHDGKIEFIIRQEIKERNKAIANEVVVAAPPVPTEENKEEHLLQNALLLIDAGDYFCARHVLGHILQKNPMHADAIRWMGYCFKQEGQLENAQKCYEQLLNLRVTENDLFELGEIYCALGKDIEAQSVWLDALGICEAESPRLFDLHKNLGNVFTRQGDYESAEENYNKALVLRPNSDVLQVNLGTLHFQQQFFKTAMEHYKNAIELNPYNDKGWCGVALIAKEMQDDEWAAATVLKSLELNPYNRVALELFIAWIPIHRKFSETIRLVQNYVDRFQDDGDMIFSLAYLHFQAGDLIASDLELSRLEALQPERSDSGELRQKLEKRKREGV